MTEQSKKATTVLDRLVSRATRDERLLELLTDFENGYSQGWYMALPDAFKAPLDIRQTARVVNKQQTLQWTQGGNFSFKQGDVIYDTPKAYDEWARALHHLKLCICIKHATDAGSPEAEGKQGRAARQAGFVAFDILQPNDQKTAIEKVGEHTCTQDEFVRFLINGPLPSWPSTLKK